MLSKTLFRLFSTQSLEGPRKYSEIVSRARNVMDLYNLTVYSEGTNFIAPNATVIGEVFMGSKISIWHGTVIRGDINRITYHQVNLDSRKILVSATTVFFILLLPLQQD